MPERDSGSNIIAQALDPIPYIGWKEQCANAAYIAACSPDSLRALLAERDELAKDAARLRDALVKAVDYLKPRVGDMPGSRGHALMPQLVAALTNKD